MARVIVLGPLEERSELQRLLRERHPEVVVDTVGKPWELRESVRAMAYDAAVVAKGPIAEHQDRLGAVVALRQDAFTGRILYAGTFLNEKQDATAAGADVVFDPTVHAAEEVVVRALHRPVLLADHPYLRHLFVGEWATLGELAGELPAAPPDVLLAATSLHPDAAFYTALARYSQAHPRLRCVLVEDGGSDDALVAALASGVQPYVVLADEGLQTVAAHGRRFLRESWLRHVMAPA